MIIGIIVSLITGIKYKKRFFAYIVFFVLCIIQDIAASYSSVNGAMVASWTMKIAMLYLVAITTFFVMKGDFE